MTREEFKEALRIVASDNFDDIPDNPPEHVFSARHQRRMRRLFKSVERRDKTTMRTLPKVAMIAVATITAFTFSVTQIKAIREPFLELVTNIYDKFATVDYVGNGHDHIVDTYKLTYIPDGFSLVQKQETVKNIFYEYHNTSDKSIIFDQFAANSAHYNIDNENGTFSTFNIFDMEITLYQSDYCDIAYWSQDGYYMKLTLIGDFSKDTIIKMIESVKPID